MARIIPLQCLICNQAFFGSHTRKYCSPECRSTGTRKGETVQCKHCSAPIYRKLKDVLRSTNWFCSAACHYAHGRIDKQCVQCQSAFTCIASEAVHRRFCSKKCEGLFRSSGEPVNVTCTWCKSEFLLSPALNNRPGSRYCSVFCRRAFARARSSERSQNLCTTHGKPIQKDGRCAYCVTRDWGWKQKLIVLNHYGNTCACCNESMLEFLTIDHIDNDGAQVRREYRKTKGTPGGGRNYYRWIIKAGFPANLQVLCLNCNAAKHWYGICPHKQRPVYTQKTLA